MTKNTIWMPSVSVKLLKYYPNKPSGIFSDYDTSGFRVYHHIPKRENPIQKNRLVEVFHSFQITPNVKRMKVLGAAKNVIYHRYKDILQEKQHYVIILRPGILFLQPSDFRIQYYAAMNLVGGFKDPELAQNIFKEETKFMYSSKVAKELYSTDYMSWDPFDTSGVWTNINQIWKTNYNDRTTLNSMLAKTIIFSVKAQHDFIIGSRKPKTLKIVRNFSNNTVTRAPRMGLRKLEYSIGKNLLSNNWLL